MSYGLTATGYTIQDLETIRARLQADWRAQFGDDVDLNPSSPDGAIVDSLSQLFLELWEGVQAVYAAADPAQSTGDGLDAVSQLTATFREPTSPSTVTVTVTGDAAGTTVAAGKQFSIPGAGSKWNVVTGGNTALAQEYAAFGDGDIIEEGWRAWTDVGGGVFHVYEALNEGAIDTPKDTPTGTTTSVDNDVTWRFVGIGKATVDVECESDENGPVNGTALTITQIETPILGINSCVNLLDATLGRVEETDDELAFRREDELRSAGSSHLDAIRAAVLDVKGVTLCKVLENQTDTTDANNLPPHSICVVVLGGESADIAAAVFLKAGGIATYGNTSASVIDSAGDSHTMYFHRPTEVNIYVANTVTYDAALYPEDGDDLIKEAQVTFGDRSSVGKDAISSALAAQCFQVAGVLKVTTCYIGTAPSPSSAADVSISPLQIAVYDTSRITVSSSAATP